MATRAPRTWLLTIARRTCADAVRRAIRQRRLVERISSSIVPGDELVEEPDSPAASGLDGLVEQLDHDRRIAFVLTQLIGLSYAEAAGVCDVPVGTVRSRVSRARADLVELLGDTGAELAEG